MSSPTFEKHLSNPSLQRLGKRILTRWFFESLVVVSTGVLVGMLVKALHRGLGHPVITGSYSFQGFQNVGVMEHAHEGMLVGLIAGTVISFGYGLIGVIVRIFRRQRVPISGRMGGMISGTLVACLLVFERQVSASFSGGMSTLEWRIVNTPVDLALLCLLGAVGGAAWGALVARSAEAISAHQG
jgi:hypothetical protein